ncbi:MFS general substrate transporter [Nemania abortiva]|nr:MFS general substrate transporter [Nemania abortiva]
MAAASKEGDVIVAALETGDDHHSGATRPQRFWEIFGALCILAFICALDVAIITTALPTISAAIDGGAQYIWLADSFLVVLCVCQPLFGQLADIFGRQGPLAVSTALFIIGSGVAGGANNAAGLIAGRTVQGIGAGGLYVLLDIICCDMLPLRERGKFVGLLNAFAGIAAAIGPVVGAAIAEANWRWIFYLNIPICGVAFVAILLFLRMKTGKEGTFKSRLRRLDIVGSTLFITSILALLIGLVIGGIEFPWSSWRIILPISLGVAGWAAFHLHQHFIAKFPSVPTRLFANRTSAVVYILTFLSSILVQMLSYFLPVWLQGAHGDTILQSGTDFLPFAIGALVVAVVSGVLLSKFGKYRPFHAAAFALSAIGYGLMTLLEPGTPTVAWVFFQLIASAGLGITLSAILPAIMAALDEADVAVATAAYAFIKTFGYVWGVTIPSVIFNAAVDSNLYLISEPTYRDQLRNGAAYSFASKVHVLKHSESPELVLSIKMVYARSLKVIWWVGVGISLLGLLLVAGEKELELRTELDTEYGLREEKRKSDEEHSLGTDDPIA